MTSDTCLNYDLFQSFCRRKKRSKKTRWSSENNPSIHDPTPSPHTRRALKQYASCVQPIPNPRSLIFLLKKEEKKKKFHCGERRSACHFNASSETRKLKKKALKLFAERFVKPCGEQELGFIKNVLKVVEKKSEKKQNDEVCIYVCIFA